MTTTQEAPMRRIAAVTVVTALASLFAAAPSPAATGDVAIESVTLKLRELTVRAACRHDAVARLRLDGRPSGRATFRCHGTRGRAELRLSAADAARARSAAGISASIAITDGEHADRFTARLRRPHPGRRARADRIARMSAAPQWSIATASCISHPEYGYKAFDLTAYSETYGVQAGQNYAYRMWVLTAAPNGSQQKWFTNGWATGFAALYPNQGFGLTGSGFWASVGVENAFGHFRWVRISRLAGPVSRGYGDHDWCFFH